MMELRKLFAILCPEIAKIAQKRVSSSFMNLSLVTDGPMILLLYAWSSPLVYVDFIFILVGIPWYGLS